ncbi:MAG: hypothetical protein Q4B26_13965 [Eubacteriales bacterium]|nr:hypothetical protein [Eubacteriales bacterium]
MSKKGLWQGGATLMASLLMFSTAAQITTNNWSARLNSMLGTSNYKVNVGDTSKGTHFVSEFSSLKEMVDAQTEFTAQIGAEGCVLMRKRHFL